VTVWVTGAAGLLGREVVASCKRLAVEHVSTTRDDLDITDAVGVTAFAKKHGVRRIINCAAYTAVDGAETETELAFAVNADAVRNLAQAGRELGASVLHVSTDYVFDGKAATPYEEKHSAEPINKYGASKLAGEQALLEILGDTEIPHYVVRVSWLFGLGKDTFLGKVIQRARREKTMKIVEDERGRPTYVPDVARAMLQLCGIEGDRRCDSGIYHFANHGEVTRMELAREGLRLAESLGPFATLEPTTAAAFAAPADRPTYTVFSTQKIEAALGYAPRPWQQAVADYMQRWVEVQDA